MKSVGNPKITEVSKKSRWQPLDNTKEKIGKKVFGIKLPLIYEKKLSSLDQKERVTLMRKALIEAINNHDKLSTK